MNKIILTVIGILVLGIVVAALVFTTFFKTPSSTEPNPTIGSSPLYTYQYSNIIYPNMTERIESEPAVTFSVKNSGCSTFSLTAKIYSSGK